SRKSDVCRREPYRSLRERIGRSSWCPGIELLTNATRCTGISAEPSEHYPRPPHDLLRLDAPVAANLRHDVADVPAPMQMRSGRRAIDRRPGIGAHDPMIRPALRIRIEDELRHLMLMPGEVRPLVEFEHELAHLGPPAPHVEGSV